MSSRSDPRRLSSILGLATTRLRRYMQSNQREDLDKAILHLTESILLPPSLWLEQGPMIFTAVFFLGLAFSKRLIMFNQLEDAIYATNYLGHLRDQPQAAFACPRNAVTTLLLNVLARNIVQNIEEMETLCHELLECVRIRRYPLRHTRFWTSFVQNPSMAPGSTIG
ncbi:hypothetical protein EDB89DRAFT_1234913 [Lactarius sanguifluus]|nr:hypothetical protein EDB89DRAFT_1234913 [Lactarius sanguifluus]